MKILFIANLREHKYLYSDNATRYRCFNPAEDLNDLGYAGDVCNFDEFDMRYIDWYDAFIFHRPRISRRLEKILSRLSYKRKLYIADYDDLIFDERYAEESSLYLSGKASLNNLKHRYRENLAAMQLFTHISVSTEALKKAVSLCHPGAEVTIIHNGLSKRWVMNNIGFVRKVWPQREKIISYLSGSPTHDYDFPEVEDVLSDYVRANKDVILMIVGPLNFNRKKFGSDKVRFCDKVPYGRLPELISDSWVTIAPLQNTVYNNCKTGLKFFESAVFGVPVIASPIPDMLRYADNGLMIAYNSGDWWKAFEELRNRELYMRVSQQIREFSLEHCMSYIETDKMAVLINGLLRNRVHAEGRSLSRHWTVYDSETALPVKTYPYSRTAKLARKLFRDPRQFILDSRIMQMRALSTIFIRGSRVKMSLLRDISGQARRPWQKNE